MTERIPRLAVLTAAALLPLSLEWSLRRAFDPFFVTQGADYAVAAGLVLLAVSLALVPRRISRETRPALALGLTAWFVASSELFGLASGLSAASGRRETVFLAGLALIAGSVAATVLARVMRDYLQPPRALRALAILHAVALSPGLLVPAALQHSAKTRATEPPDVLLVVLDTARPDHLSVYGYERPTTPSLERLSRRARVYERAWSPAPWTPPAHASLFTGLLPAQHGCEGWVCETEAPTLAQILRASGFATLGVVNNPMLGGAQGWARGFDDYRGVWERPGFSTALLRWLLRSRDENWRFTGDAEATLEWVRHWWLRNASRPRFVMVNLIDPHSPYGRGDRRSEIFQNDSTRLAPELPDDSEHYDAGYGRAEGAALQRLVAFYDADILHMDLQLGRLFDWLDRREELDSTVVVVTADHGERLGERGLIGHQLGLDEVLLRVPLIVRYPARIPPGRDDRPVQTHGVFATLLELAGVPEPAATDPRARALELQKDSLLVGQMKEQAWYLDSLKKKNPSFDPAPFLGHWASVSDGDWKLVSSTAGMTRLYFLPEDPEEKQDVSSIHPEKVSELAPLLAALPPFGETPESAEVPEETRDLLEALGYVD